MAKDVIKPLAWDCPDCDDGPFGFGIEPHSGTITDATRRRCVCRFCECGIADDVVVLRREDWDEIAERLRLIQE